MGRKNINSHYTFQYFRVGVGALEPVEEGVSELGKRPELLLRINGQSVAGNDPVVVGMHNSDESKVIKYFFLKLNRNLSMF